jgi:glyoxylase-like metal-dependent hydrolase (beta-lactamase superfamily II)
MKFATLAVALSFIACSHDSHPAAPATPVAAGEIHRFKIGALDAIALEDGGMQLPNDGKTVALGHDPAEVSTVLTKGGAPGDHFDLSIQPLYVDDGAKGLLFDTGNGGADSTLSQSFRLAGITPIAVTDIFISHSHHDHVGGLVNASGYLAFSEARVHMSAAEWTEMQANPKLKDIATAIAPRVVTFEPGAQILPDVKAVDTHGHTTGHSSYDIVSGGEHLFYIGDVVHSYVISVQQPTWPIEFDEDQALGATVRAATLAKLAADKTRVYAVHFPFPGLGHIGGSGDALMWQPE